MDTGITYWLVVGVVLTASVLILYPWRSGARVRAIFLDLWARFGGQRAVVCPRCDGTGKTKQRGDWCWVCSGTGIKKYRP